MERLALLLPRPRGRANFNVLNLCRQLREKRDCRSVELRALCNEVPRTPPDPEGSNGTGNASGAAVHPKFLALRAISNPSSVLSQEIRERGLLPPTGDR
jgi:hypothetical protein